jgi:hypothetical protein
VSPVEAVKIIERRDGTPEEWDWTLAEAALIVAKEIKRLWDREDAAEAKKAGAS